MALSGIGRGIAAGQAWPSNLLALTRLTPLPTHSVTAIAAAAATAACFSPMVAHGRRGGASLARGEAAGAAETAALNAVAAAASASKQGNPLQASMNSTSMPLSEHGALASASLSSSSSSPSSSSSAPAISAGHLMRHMGAASNLAQIEAVVDAFRELKSVRGSVEFIEAAITRLDALDLDIPKRTYDKLLDVFPKNHTVTRSWLDVMWPRENAAVETALKLLQRMEDASICPDLETFKPVFYAFGKKSVPVRKCESMYYWMTLFGMNPKSKSYQIKALPEDLTLVTQLALNRLVGVSDAQIHQHGVFQRDGNGAVDVGHVDHVPPVVSYERPEALAQLDGSKSLVVTGPHLNWFRRTFQPYYTISPESEPSQILGYCMTTRHDDTTLMAWIRAVPKFATANIRFNFSPLAKTASTLHGQRFRRQLYGRVSRLPTIEEQHWQETPEAQKLIAASKNDFQA
ncbi:hypothetical protein CAOG_04859 [Capsaspora owczarzaki ATCC 30864]|uniref:ECSIT N-terminal domain-containing protein n=1 Tax=Capsaspora owczarzaki (strain ATCC 30864) TaxID=595528 RepID=A0A0D2VSR5_CAPO3|nr:hypothetical protein CAOG_04859 [Capsaspora owczarzaki ATCC 30864]KJE94177.1 hypothetical protein CAOG_004859 [Capsaspora owczarzaki ATCC 30864]|eukprot:XP_004347610.1 hypothetical protein CAOG_04859 [Capsaspora owczarzaki ATCC 30864]